MLSWFAALSRVLCRPGWLAAWTSGHRCLYVRSAFGNLAGGVFLPSGCWNFRLTGIPRDLRNLSQARAEYLRMRRVDRGGVGNFGPANAVMRHASFGAPVSLVAPLPRAARAAARADSSAAAVPTSVGWIHGCAHVIPPRCSTAGSVRHRWVLLRCRYLFGNPYLGHFASWIACHFFFAFFFCP